MAETRETSPAQLEALRDRINTLTLDMLGMAADNIVLAPIHSVLKTSSGKIRRAACRELFEKGATPARAVWWQVVRLAWAGILPEMRRGIRVVSDVLFAAYAWAAVLAARARYLAGRRAAAPLRPGAGRQAMRSRGCMRDCVQRRSSSAAWKICRPPRPACLWSNHASYLDGIVIVAALPGKLSSAGYYSFVAKRELLDSFISRIYLKRIGSDFVERFESQRSLEDVKQVAHSLQSGRQPCVLPGGHVHAAYPA